MNSPPENRMTRWRGFVVLINTFLPAAMVLLFLWGGWAATVKINAMLVQTRNSAEHIIRSARTAKESVVLSATRAMEAAEKARLRGKAITDGIGGMARAVNREIGKVAKTFNDAAAVIVLPIPDGMDAQKMARKKLQKLFEPVTAPFRTLAGQFSSMAGDLGAIKDEIAAVASEVGKLRGLEAYLDAVIAEYANIRDEAAAALAFLARAVRVVVFAAIMLLLWAGLGYALWVRGRVSRALSMMRG